MENSEGEPLVGSFHFMFDKASEGCYNELTKLQESYKKVTKGGFNMAVKPKAKTNKKKGNNRPTVTSIRDLAPNRSTRLFADQVETIEELEEKYGVSLNINELVRNGLDIVLEQTKELLQTKN